MSTRAGGDGSGQEYWNGYTEAGDKERLNGIGIGVDGKGSRYSLKTEKIGDAINWQNLPVTRAENRVRMTIAFLGIQSIRCCSVVEICGESFCCESGCAWYGVSNRWSMTCRMTKAITSPAIAIHTCSEKLYRKNAPDNDLDVLSTCVTTFILSKACSGRNSTAIRLGFSHHPDMPISQAHSELSRTIPWASVQLPSMLTNSLKFSVPNGLYWTKDEQENPVISCNAVSAAIDKPSKGGWPTDLRKKTTTTMIKKKV